MSAESRACSRCGAVKPLGEFPKHRHLSEGRGWAAREAWYCGPCMAEKATAGVRRYRSDPEKAERDRGASRAWKERNREHNRARDRAYKAAKRAAA